MAHTMAEKILARAAGKKEVFPGELINARIDMALGNDITAPVAINEFRKIGIEKVFDRERIALIPDHFTPNKDIQSAEQVKLMRNFAREQGIVHYYEVGRMGIEHALLPELGLVLPGEVVVGADSHTCTYGALGAFATGVGSTDLAAVMATGELWFKVPPTIRVVFEGELPPWVSGKDLILYTIGQLGVDGARYAVLEFTGPAITALPMDARFSISNMAIEAGAKAGLIPPDAVTLRYLEDRAVRPYETVLGDEDAPVLQEFHWDVENMEPQVSAPFSPANAQPVSQVAGTEIDQVVIGSCTNGRIDDLRQAAALLKGRKVHPRVRLIVIPATQAVYLQALREGLLEIFAEAEAAVSTPTCGPCLGGHMGILAEGEVAVATTNRNFVGRMGHRGSRVYLAGPAVAAASAVAGVIAHPLELGEVKK
ncbi:MAG TPA: 3-isopropylmalate dehydratase large subunit [Firmicutes bacterium]|jgi:3-isopropylmalate/(R)-2-methylmalate dehydratase large subunit|nr:3-isopropylmalate dehydratase large subunit [Bacillota bacterium]HAA35165.1 3-isopropylmalate dehydratase large subunit [Bacillota bacterium]